VIADALVTRNVPSRAAVIGNPAQLISFSGTGAYMAAEE
jgi:acetyltransferase-like isoleucine patch superfamily enzyme